MDFVELRNRLNESVEKIDGHKVEFTKKGGKVGIKIDGHFFDTFPNDTIARKEIKAFIKAAK